MVQPRLIHPVSVTIQRIDRATTVYDEDAREPVQQASRFTNLILQGQPRWTSGEQLRISRDGPTVDADGYVLFRYRDLDAAGITLQINDRITQIGRRTLEVYIVRLDDAGHYTDTNGASLVRAWFKDRKPAKERAS
jgi:hypothetical protein